MRNSIAMIAVVAVPAGDALAGSGSASSLPGSASAQAIVPLVLDHQPGRELRFGRFAAGVGGTVTLDPASGVASTTGGATFVVGSVTNLDRFNATGDPNRQIGILTGSGTVNDGTWTMNFTTATSPSSLTLSPAGTVSFNVGGTLTAAPNQPAGHYAGSYNVTVTYQ